MGAKSQFESAVLKVVKEHLPVVISEGVVKTVDKDNKTCNVTRVGAADLTGVRLNAVLESGESTFTIFPAVDSSVLVGIVEGNPADAFVVSMSVIDKVVINNAKCELALDDKVILKNNESNLKDLLVQIKDIITNLKVLTGVGPSVGLTPDALASLQKLNTDINLLFE